MLRGKRYNKHLDIGCGTGALLKRLESYSDKKYGCDLNAMSLPGITFRKADLNKQFPFDEKFDLITCIEVIEHVENQFQLIRDIKRSLSAKGICVISTPNNYSIFNKLYFMLGNNLIHFNNRNMLTAGHINPLFENIFIHNLNKSGLKIIKKQYSDGFIPIFNRSICIRNRFFGNVVIYVIAHK
jgi:2-polyprenyl-3-methyl-5-hydroxy-6-metoxy-1,4-benzoquinol methylase